MNADVMLIFPLIPLSAAFLVLSVKYLAGKEISLPALYLSAAGQLAAGVLLAFQVNRTGAVTAAVSSLPFSIQLSVDRAGLYFLAAYLVPLLLTLPNLHLLKKTGIRIAFLFYMTGCSAVIVSGDIFNFFVAYELMIMSAYILISGKGKVFASVKYMLVGAVSSLFFLAAIAAVLAAGRYLDFPGIEGYTGVAQTNLKIILVLFSSAFMIKSALFPAGWVASCHAAADAPVSMFLSSFSLFCGIYGLYYLVLIPAQAAQVTQIFSILTIVSLATIGSSAVFAFFESSPKRSVAWSSVFSTGVTGWLMAEGAFETALMYLAAHSIYKSLMFRMINSLESAQFRITGRRAAWLLVLVLFLFSAGIFPAYSHLLKAQVSAALSVSLFMLLSGVILVAGFFKFSFVSGNNQPAEGASPLVTGITGVLLAASVYFLILSNGIKLKPLYPAIEWGALALVLLLRNPLRKLSLSFSDADKKTIFPNLNAELLALLVPMVLISAAMVLL